MIIDNAYNIPDLDSPVRMVNPSTELLIALSPERTYTTPGIRSFSPEQRQCYYSDEVSHHLSSLFLYAMYEVGGGDHQIDRRARCDRDVRYE